MSQDELLQWFSQDRRKSNRDCVVDARRQALERRSEPRGRRRGSLGAAGFQNTIVVGLFEAKGLDVEPPSEDARPRQRPCTSGRCGRRSRART